MDWNNLNALVAVSQEGSLAGAARRLGVNHSTISRRLAALEHDVGAKVVRRLARSTPLTDRGRQIAILATEMQDRALKIQRLTQLETGRISGTVRLSAPPALISETLMPELGEIAAAHPDLRLELVADARITSLARGDADIAIRLIKPREPQFVIRKLGKIAYGLYGVAELVNQPEEVWRFIGFEPNLADSPAQKWLADFAKGRRFSLMSNDFHVQKSAAEAGIGIAMLPVRIARRSKSLTVAMTPPPPDREAWLVFHSDVRNAPAVQIVANAISKIFNEY